MKKTIEILPSIIAKTQTELDTTITKVASHFNTLHLDIMDGKFVDNHSLDFDFTTNTDKKIEAHLMVHHPEYWLDDNWEKADTFIVHAEACEDIKGIIGFIKSKNKKIGIALNPETPVKQIKELLEEIDRVLVMTVHPGQYGAQHLPNMSNKIREIRKLAPSLDIEVDGGITDKTIKYMQDSGANIFVSGSFIMKSQDPRASIQLLKKVIQ